MTESVVLYDLTTLEVLAIRYGDNWVVPESWGVYGGTIDEVNQLLKDDEDGNVFFVDGVGN